MLAEGDVAFTARGLARVIQEPLACDEEYVAIAIGVEHVDDHRQPAFDVDSGVGRTWIDGGEQRRLGARVGELAQLTFA